MNLEIKDLIPICTNINVHTHVHGVGVSRTSSTKFAEKVYNFQKQNPFKSEK